MGAKSKKAVSAKEAIDMAERHLRDNSTSAATLRTVLSVLLMLVKMLLQKSGLDSTNSSLPPSQDPFRENRGDRRPKDKKKTGKQSGGQQGHKGSWLKPVDNPDQVQDLKIDRRTLPRGEYKNAGYVARQVIEIKIHKIVKEYRAEILQDQSGNRFTAPFPEGVTRPAQYGASVKAQAVYMSQFQLVPYDRLQGFFSDQCDIPLSQGSLVSFNSQAYEMLEPFEAAVKDRLRQEPVLQADETGINIGGKLQWLHSVGSQKLASFFPHNNRGEKAMAAMGVLPTFTGILCHDHWKAYFRLDCLHSLCNAHHLRELEAVHQQYSYKWPLEMKRLLVQMHACTRDGATLDEAAIKRHVAAYEKIIARAEKECPTQTRRPNDGKRGRVAQGKARNLLTRMRDYQTETLRFLTHPLVPFTNNRSENDIRMTKVQQKISGCFRSMLGAQVFCRVRGYLLTCQKHGISASQALNGLFMGEFPEPVRYLLVQRTRSN